MMPRRPLAVFLAGSLAAAAPLGGQSLQYRSPAGMEYRSQPDTGAIARAERALAADPRNVSLLVQLGLAQSGVRQYREAIGTFTRGLELAPNDPLLYRWRGHRYLSTREFGLAFADLNRGSRLDSTNYGIWYHLGIVKYARGDFAGAAEAFANAQRRAPDAAELAGSTDWLWMALSRAGRSTDAKAMLARRPDSLPANNAYTQRLKLYRGEIRPQQLFTPADTADIAIATLSYGLGNWYLLRGDTARARQAFERSVRSGGWPAFGFILSEIELAQLAGEADPGLARLATELARLSGIAQGRVGIGVIHLESGRELFQNAVEPFPMASTVKVPIATALFDLVDRGRLRLDSMITLQPSDLHPGSGTLSNLFNDPGVSLSLLNLTELMLLISDNSATDLVLRTVGGGAPVNARLAALGISGISVDRPTIELIADASGIKGLPPESQRTLVGFAALARTLNDSTRRAAREAFYRDPRDTATPLGMARLLAKLWRREALSPERSAQLLDILFRVETGLLRLKGMLPPGIRVAHKTGTLSLGVTNDVGILELPGDAGHLVLAVFVKESRASAEDQERVIAQIARSVYDYFVFNPGGHTP